MFKKSFKRAIIFFLGLVIIFSMERSTFAYDNPDLLPKEQTPIIDLAKALSDKQRLDLEKDYWGLDDTSLLIIADPRGGNLLSFNVGDAYFALMPRIFWVELQTRFGNQFYVRDNGEKPLKLV